MKRRFSRIIAVVLISVALNPLALKAQGNADEAAIKNLVEQFFVAHQKRDLDGMMACWSAKSPQFTSIKQSVQSELAQYDETQYMNVTFSQWKIDTNRASVRLRYEVKRRDVRTKQPFLKTFIVNLAFVREADGWKFSEKFSARTALAIRLFEAKTKEERSELLKSNGDLVTTELVTVFVPEFLARQPPFVIAMAMGRTSIGTLPVAHR